MNTKQEEFLNDLTAFMIRHNIIIVRDENLEFSIIDESGNINISIEELYYQRIGAERYE